MFSHALVESPFTADEFFSSHFNSKSFFILVFDCQQQFLCATL